MIFSQKHPILQLLKHIALFILLLTSLTLGATELKSSLGHVTISHWSGEPVKLDIPFYFFWKEFLFPGQIQHSKPYTIGFQWPSGEAGLPAHGYGTYIGKIEWEEPAGDMVMINIPNISSSYILYVDGAHLGGMGKIGKTPEKAFAQIAPGNYFFIPKGKTTEIRLLVSNFHDMTGGIWSHITIGSANQMISKTKSEISKDLFLGSSLLIIGLFFVFFGLSLSKFKRWEYTFFGLFSLIMSLRLLVMGERLLPMLLSGLSWNIWGAIEYWTIYAAIPVFGLFTGAIFPSLRPAWHKPFFIFAFIAGTLFVLIAPISIITAGLNLMQLYLLIFCLYYLYIILTAVVKKERGAKTIISGFAILFGAIINDIIVSNSVIRGVHLTPLGTFLFFVLLSLFLAQHFFDTQVEHQNLSQNLQETNRKLKRFVPYEILQTLGKKDLAQIEIGENTSETMTVLFSNIKSFNKLSEEMNSTECFTFLNSVFNHMAPVIRKHGGFIDKYIGDSIMALFPGSSNAALAATVEMQETINKYNQGRTRAGYKTIKIGMGLHSGKVALGTLGEKERMEGTVISDVVNLARRIEGLTHLFDAYTIISDEVFRNIDHSGEYSYSFLGRIQVKGKRESIGMYEIINGCEPAIFSRKKNQIDLFERGLLYYHLKQFPKAMEMFHKILQTDPNHKATLFYISDCEKTMQKETPDEWQGALVMEVK